MVNARREARGEAGRQTWGQKGSERGGSRDEKRVVTGKKVEAGRGMNMTALVRGVVRATSRE